MAMGIVSHEEFLKELDRHRNKVPEKTEDVTAEVREKKDRGWNGGRGEGNTEVPESIRKVIAGTSIEDRLSNARAAEIFGVSPQSVSAYKNGTTSLSTYHSKDRDLNEYVNAKRSEVSGKARGVLFGALDKITEEKLSATKARDLAGIAKDMSAIIKDMEDTDSSGSQTNIIFYSPKPKMEEDYVTIDISE